MQQLTGRAVIQLSTSTSDNSIVLLPGANASLSSSLAPSSLRQPLSSYSHLLLQNEIPLASTIDWLEAASSEGVQIIYNPSPMPTKEQLSTFPWSKVDWLLTNEGEARELLGSTGQTQGEHYIKDLKRKLSTDEGKGPNIVVTKGENGMAVLFNGELVSCAAGEVVGGVKDTTGAGDCFTVGYNVSISLCRNFLTKDFFRGTLPPCFPLTRRQIQRKSTAFSASHLKQRLCVWKVKGRWKVSHL